MTTIYLSSPSELAPLCASRSLLIVSTAPTRILSPSLVMVNRTRTPNVTSVYMSWFAAARGFRNVSLLGRGLETRRGKLNIQPVYESANYPAIPSHSPSPVAVRSPDRPTSVDGVEIGWRPLWWSGVIVVAENGSGGIVEGSRWIVCEAELLPPSPEQPCVLNRAYWVWTSLPRTVRCWRVLATLPWRIR